MVDFMLMPDGSVVPNNDGLMSPNINLLLRKHGGVAFYWKCNPGGWYAIHAATMDNDSQGGMPMADAVVPDVVKLAAMIGE